MVITMAQLQSAAYVLGFEEDHAEWDADVILSLEKGDVLSVDLGDTTWRFRADGKALGARGLASGERIA